MLVRPVSAKVGATPSLACLPFSLVGRRWATNLGGGSTKNGRDSAGKRLGVKLGNGATANANQVLVKQRGSQYWAGSHVIVGRDHTLHAACAGVVQYTKDHDRKRTYINILPLVRNPLPSPTPGEFVLKDIGKLFNAHVN